MNSKTTVKERFFYLIIASLIMASVSVVNYELFIKDNKERTGIAKLFLEIAGMAVAIFIPAWFLLKFFYKHQKKN